MVGADVGDDADVVGRDAHALEEHAAPGGLEDADVEARRLEDAACAGGPGEVALLLRLAHDDDTVGRAPCRREARGHAHVSHEPGRRRLAVGAGHGRDGDAGGDDAGAGTVGRGHDDRCRLLDDRVGAARRVEQPGHDGADLLPGDAATRAVHPREGEHDVLDRLTCANAYAQASCADLRTDPARHGADHAHDEPLAQRGATLAGTGRAHTEPARQRLGLGALEVEVAGHVQDDLDRRPGEVEVGPVEHPHLVDPDRLAAPLTGTGTPSASVVVRGLDSVPA